MKGEKRLEKTPKRHANLVSIIQIRSFHSPSEIKTDSNYICRNTVFEPKLSPFAEAIGAAIYGSCLSPRYRIVTRFVLVNSPLYLNYTMTLFQNSLISAFETELSVAFGLIKT